MNETQKKNKVTFKCCGTSLPFLVNENKQLLKTQKKIKNYVNNLNLKKETYAESDFEI